MDRLVRQIDEERLIGRAIDESLNVVGEQIGRVALGLHPLAIDIQRRIDRFALAGHRHPVVEPRPRAVVVAHVPLAEEPRAIAGALQLQREHLQVVAWPRVLSMMPLVCGYWPVRKLARLGEQSGVVANAFVNLAPSRASRSMCGVSMNGWPATRISSQRMSSTSTMTMFGRRGRAGGGEERCCLWSGAPHVIVTRAARRTSSSGPSSLSLSQHVAALSLSNQPVGIGLQKEALFDEARGGGADDGNVARVRSVAFLERRARITRCDALGLCSRERDESAAQGLNASLEESFRDRVQPVYVPSGAWSSTLRTPAVSLPSESTRGTSMGRI